MKHVVLIGALLMATITGCASSGEMDSRLNQLRTEIYSEMRNRTDDLRDSTKKEIRDTDGATRKEMKELQNKLQTDIAKLTETQNKYSIATDKTLIDHQKQIFQNKAFVEDTARRVYMLESVVTAKSSVAPQQIKEGYITFFDDTKLSISLGSVNGVKAGDSFAVYKDSDKIGVIEIDVVERDSSSGKVLEKSKPFSIGDRVELEKK